MRWRDIIGISTFRLSAMLGAVFVVGLVAMLGVVYAATARDLTARSDRILHAAAQRLLQVPADQLPDRVRYEMRRDRAGFNYLALIAADGTPIVGNVRLLRPLPPAIPSMSRTDRAAPSAWSRCAPARAKRCSSGATSACCATCAIPSWRR
ncbi:hypothetical protein P0F65_09855 [Sphingomonas sp. I4]